MVHLPRNFYAQAGRCLLRYGDTVYLSLLVISWVLTVIYPAHPVISAVVIVQAVIVKRLRRYYRGCPLVVWGKALIRKGRTIK